MEIPPEEIANSFGTYIRGVAESVPVKDIIPPVDNYRKHVTQRFITRRETDIPHLLGEEFIVSVKVDGAFSGYYYNEEKKYSFFFNVPQHRVYIGLPVNKDLEDILQKNTIREALLVGELFCSTHDPVDFSKRSHIYELAHCRRNPSTQDDLERIGFKVFDVLEIDRKKWITTQFRKRYNKIHDLFPKEGRLSVVKTQIFKNPYEILEFYRKEVIEHNHEGIIIRTGNIAYKIKPIHVIDVAIIAIAEGREGTKIGRTQLASSLVALRYLDGKYQVLSRVGGGLTDEMRSEVLNKFRIEQSKDYIPITSDGRAMKMVYPGVVGQIEYEDIITYSGEDPIYQPCLLFDEKTNSWELVRQVPFLSLIAPRFIEEEPIREDKNALNITDVRISQIMDLVDIPRFDKISKYEYELSELLARKVYVKGDAMVRKFMMWKTNKSMSNEYPEYVVYHLDYSKNRKDPLVRDIKGTNIESQAWELFDSIIQSEMIGTKGDIKRGWKKYAISDART
ncbi:MAG: RNA ligase family protein [Candidatus Thorarchaeota archaeon]